MSHKIPKVIAELEPEFSWEMQAFWPPEEEGNPPFDIKSVAEFEDVRKGAGWTGTHARLIRVTTTRQIVREMRPYRHKGAAK